MNSIYTPQNLQENNANFRVSLIKWSNFRAARGGSAALKLPGNLQLFPGGSDRKMSIQKKMKIYCARRRFRTKIKSLETTKKFSLTFPAAMDAKAVKQQIMRKAEKTFGGRWDLETQNGLNFHGFFLIFYFSFTFLYHLFSGPKNSRF